MSVLPIHHSTTISCQRNIRKSQDTVGTANAPIGYKLQEKRQSLSGNAIKRQVIQTDHQYGNIKPRTTTLQQHIPEAVRMNLPRSTGISIIPGNDEKHNNQESIRVKEREFHKFLKILEFERKTDKMIILNRIREFVEQGMMAHEEDINIRRARLRDMLQREDAELMREVVNQIHNTEEARKEEMRIRAEEKRIQEEESRRSFITSKKRQQHFENCPETRERISRDITRGVKYSNLVQMLENEEKKQAEKKLDELWYKIMLKENESQRIRDDELKRKRAMMGKETGLILEQQIAGRSSSSGQVQRLREQERLELERLWNEVRAEEVRNLAQEREKRERLRVDLEEQLMSAKRRMVEQTRQQAEVERMLKVVNEEELKRERDAIIVSREALRKEVMAYMKNLEDLQEEQARREAEVNAIIEESAKDAQTRRDLASKRYKEERKRSLEKFLLERDEQLRLKQEAKREQEKFIEEEKNLLTKEAEVGATDNINETKRKREAALHYGKQLLAQRRYDETKKCQQAEKDRQFHNDTLKDNEEYLKLTEELVNAPEIITPSAFKIKLEEYTARRDT